MAAAAAIGIGDSCSKLSSIGIGGGGVAVAAGTISAGNFGSLATVTTMGGPPSYRTAKRIRTKKVPASYTSGSGSANKSASFTQLPEGESALIQMLRLGYRLFC